MLQITIPETEYYDDENQVFLYTKEQSLMLEHSLVSISKWEAKWRKPFLDSGERTLEECQDYVRCMTITQNVDPLIYRGLTSELFEKVNKYIEEPMTATWFSDKKGKGGKREIITSEVIYYWMVALNIPFECEKWHLNRLLALIRVCNIKNGPEQKMSLRDVFSRNRALNAARRMKSHSKG